MTDAVEVTGLSYAYGQRDALHDLALTVPQGSIYALLGANGAGKTTLLQILAGLRRAPRGQVALLGAPLQAFGWRDRRRVGYLAESQPLPRWMRLRDVENYLAPLYPGWDHALASELRDRFAIDPDRWVKTFSRGEHMKAALLCALAPRPQLLLMDEPFAGMDVMVKDELVRGLLESSGQEGWTILIASHDIGELEMLADRVGILVNGRLQVDEPMEQLRERFRRVTVMGDPGMLDAAIRGARDWLLVERAGRRLSFVLAHAHGEEPSAVLAAQFPGADRIEVHEVSLREVLLATAGAHLVGATEAAA